MLFANFDHVCLCLCDVIHVVIFLAQASAAVGSETWRISSVFWALSFALSLTPHPRELLLDFPPALQVSVVVQDHSLIGTFWLKRAKVGTPPSLPS